MGPNRQFVENIAKIRERTDLVKFAGLDHGSGGAYAAGIMTRKEKILAIILTLLRLAHENQAACVET